MRKNPGFKIFFGLCIPPLIPFLEFKTKEELELMPQTEEELQDRDDSDSSSSGKIRPSMTTLVEHSFAQPTQHGPWLERQISQFLTEKVMLHTIFTSFSS